MQTLSIGEIKTRFSEVLEKVKAGNEVIISYGKKKEKVAMIVPYRNHKAGSKRELGVLKESGRCIIHKDFNMSDEEILES